MMTSSGDRGRAVMLPPCRVCGGQASGLHFGVNTCEACKAFFRRCLKRKESHTCARDERCEINTETKSFCAYCRYKKCLRVGMSVEAVKTGRYTLERKAELLREMGQTPVSPDTVSIHSNLSLDSWEETDIKRQRRDIETENMARLVCCITDDFRSLRLNHPDILREIPDRLQVYQEEYQMLEDVFGPMKNMASQEYMDLYQQSSLTTDCRRQTWRDVLPRVEQSLLNLLKFARSLPGFSDLLVADQTQLLQRSGFMWWVINSYTAVNPDQNCFTSTSGQTFTKEEMKASQFHVTDKVDTFFEVARMLQQLGADDETQALMVAVSLTSTDDLQMMNARSVSHLQNQFIEALDLHLKNTRERHLQVLGKIMVIIANIRKVDKFKGNQYSEQAVVTSETGQYPVDFYYQRERQQQRPLVHSNHRLPVSNPTPPMHCQMQPANIGPMVGPVTNYLPTNQCMPTMQPQVQMHSQPYAYNLQQTDSTDMRYICL